MVETITTILVFSAWAGLWLLVRAEGRLLNKRYKQIFMKDLK